jgi:hypothetical protein
MRYMAPLDSHFDWKGFAWYAYFFIAIFVVAGLSQVDFTGASAPEEHASPKVVVATSFLPSAKELLSLLATSTAEHSKEEETPPRPGDRIIGMQKIDETIPRTGKFIAADLDHMKITLYENGSSTATYSILSKGRPGTPWETPSGYYSIKTKEPLHFSTIGKVYMPFSMQFYGNYFIHGWTFYPDGTPVSASFSGGCIKLSTADAQSVFNFADLGTKVLVVDSPETVEKAPLAFDVGVPEIRAESYLVADLDTGHVYAEKNATTPHTIGPMTGLMTALVANEVISFEKKLQVERVDLLHPPQENATGRELFVIGDLYYPLLMQSSQGIAHALADYYGTKRFVRWMNSTAEAFQMTATTYADASGMSTSTLSSAEDLFRLVSYLDHKKSFVIDIAQTPLKKVVAEDGSSYTIANVHANRAPVSPEHTVAPIASTEDSIIAISKSTLGGDQRNIALIILQSLDEEVDTERLSNWILAAKPSSLVKTGTPACVNCARPLRVPYRIIDI